jgi:hypothetical protein
MRDELNRRARQLLLSPKCRTFGAGLWLNKEIRIGGFLLGITSAGTLMIESARMTGVFFINSPSGDHAEIDNSDDKVAAALIALREHMILDDLANV